jgi:hypothetical protein
LRDAGYRLKDALQGYEFAVAREAHDKAAIDAFMGKEGSQMMRGQAHPTAVTAMHQHATRMTAIPGKIALGGERYIYNQLLLCGQSDTLCKSARAKLN